MPQTEEIVIQRRQLLDPPNLEVSNKNMDVNIHRTETTKILGIKIDSALTFKPHLEDILKSANGKLYLLKQLKKIGFSNAELEYFYNSVIILQYGCGAWLCAVESTTSSLDAIQKSREIYWKRTAAHSTNY